MAALACATGMAFAVAVAARLAVLAGAGALHAERGVPDPRTFAVLDVLAGVGACSAGVGVLCFGATLVAAVLHCRDRRLPLCIGLGAAALLVVAIAAGVAAARLPGYPEVAGLSVLRTALAGLAAASLPAVALGAVRTRGTRSTT